MFGEGNPPFSPFRGEPYNLVLVSALGLLLSELEVLGPLEAELLLGLALLALQSDDHLPGGLGLLVEDGLGLAAEAHLLVVVPSLTLGEIRGLSRLVLGDLVDRVLLALLSLAEGFSFLGAVNHFVFVFFRGGGNGDGGDRGKLLYV